MKANLSCPNETFININSIFYGRDQDIYNNCSIDSPLNGSCIPSNDMAGHNSAQVYERCQMRGDCTVMVSNDTFRDPCPGVKKVLKIQYSCSPSKHSALYFALLVTIDPRDLLTVGELCFYFAFFLRILLLSLEIKGISHR